jgi:hypothetical protein
MLEIQQAQEQQDIGSIIQNLANRFSHLASTVLATINTTVIDLSRITYTTLILVGIFLYFTHVERRLGKDLIKGGIILAFLAEFIFPLVVGALH